jgi:glutamyl-tRNA reductase
MKFVAYGLNHTTAPIEVREKYALDPDKANKVLCGLRPSVSEAVFLSTCNRVEFYLATERVGESLGAVQKALGAVHHLKPGEFKKYFYSYEGVDAFYHLFRVASSLDSMVLGEAQILGQVKNAFREAMDADMVCTTLNGIFSRAFAAAKRVRSQTEIARMPTSVPGVALDLAKKTFQSFSGHPVLLLGAGEMIELTAKCLADWGVKDFFIANRTFENAREIAKKLGGTPLTLEEGLRRLDKVDILLTSAGGGVLVTNADLSRAVKSRSGKPLFIIDIGVPRNVDPEFGGIAGVHLYNIDDLSSISETNRGKRQKAVQEAETILREEVDRLCHWLNTLELVPTIVGLREKFENIREAEMAKFLAKNPHLGEKEHKKVDRLTRDIMAKLLHPPSANLKNIQRDTDRFEFARMLNELFSLKENGEKSKSHR